MQKCAQFLALMLRFSPAILTLVYNTIKVAFKRESDTRITEMLKTTYYKSRLSTLLQSLWTHPTALGLAHLLPGTS